MPEVTGGGPRRTDRAGARISAVIAATALATFAALETIHQLFFVHSLFA